MTHVERIADFATRASFDLLSSRARDQVKIRILDSLGCAIGAPGMASRFENGDSCTTSPKRRADSAGKH